MLSLATQSETGRQARAHRAFEGGRIGALYIVAAGQHSAIARQYLHGRALQARRASKGGAPLDHRLHQLQPVQSQLLAGLLLQVTTWSWVFWIVIPRRCWR